jgi:hypothetical protein
LRAALFRLVHQALFEFHRVMTPRSVRFRSPVVVRREPRSDRRRATNADILASDTLEAPLPGSLLVLLSRLHRAETKPSQGAEPTA